MLSIGCDLETDNLEIVQWCCVSEYGTDIGLDASSLSDYLMMMVEGERYTRIYCHNVGHDGEYMRAFFKRLENDGWEPFYVRPRNLISATFRRGKSKIELCCTVNLSYGMSLKKAGEMLGLLKLEGFDFKNGWSKEIDMNDYENWRYVIRDSEICLKLAIFLYKRGVIKITASSSAKHMALRDTFGDDWSAMLKWRDKLPPPPLEMDRWLRRAFFGGTNHTRGKCVIKAGKMPWTKIRHSDARSMYSTVMTYDPLPVGVGKRVKTRPRGLWVGEMRVKIKLREKRDARAWYTFKTNAQGFIHGYKASEPVKQFVRYETICIDSVSYELLQKHYVVTHDIEFEETYYSFKSEIGTFAKFIGYWYEIKKNSKDKEEKNLAKIILNSFWGGLGIDPVQKHVWLDDDLHWQFEERPVKNPKGYVPMAIFITAHARRRLDEGFTKVIESGGDLIHGDTDSVIYVGREPKEVLKIGVEMGDWSDEEINDDGTPKSPIKLFYEGGAKRYIKIRENGKIDITFAGIPQNSYDDGVPYGSWVELLDAPERILEDNAVFGNEHYKIKSEWLRQIYIKSGRDPDDVNTLKLSLVTQKDGGKKAVYKTFHTNQIVGYMKK